MCFGLQSKSHCVLNTQYSPEEYFTLMDDIKEEMLKRGEYEDGLGFEFSAQAYNFSMAQIAYPLMDEEIKKLGGFVAKEPETNVGNTPVISANDIPQTIKDTTNDILNYGIKCEVIGRPFNVVASELEFYRRMKLPLPTRHPIVRMGDMFRLAPTGKKYQTVCAKCQKTIESIWNPREKSFMPYCEKCYQQEVY